MVRVLVSSITLIFFAALSCASQSSDAGSQAQSQAPTQATSQSAGAGASAPPPDQTKKKPKKVWTNEEMSSVGGRVSVVGTDSPSNNSKESSASNRGYKAQRIAAYRQQILQYRAQIDKIDKQIADFHNSKAGESSSGMDPRLRYTPTSPEDRVKQLEERKKQIQAKIDALEDAARKEGIEAGQLR